MTQIKNQLARQTRKFWSSESGSQTIELVIWMPIFVIVLALMMNVSLVFFQESQILRVVQDANRSFSMGRIRTLAENEAYVTANLDYLDATPSVNSVLDGGIITTTLTIPATSLMPFSMLRDHFQSTVLTVSSSHFVEY